jgi:hypothetical protein
MDAHKPYQTITRAQGNSSFARNVPGYRSVFHGPEDKVSPLTLQVCYPGPQGTQEDFMRQMTSELTHQGKGKFTKHKNQEDISDRENSMS